MSSGRFRSPASQKKGKSESQEHLKARQEVELQLKGNDDLVCSPPENLDDLAKEYYIFIYEEMKDTSLLSNLDIPLMANLADALSKMEQADEYIKEQGLIIYAGENKGVPIYKEHPAIAIKMKYLTHARPMMALLGLSPTSRASLAETKMKKKIEGEDPLLALLSGKDD